MKRKLMIISGLIIVLALAVLAGWFAMSKLYSANESTQQQTAPIEGASGNTAGSDDSQSGISSEARPTPSGFQAPAMTAIEAKQLAENLVSQDMATYRTAFAVKDGQGVPPLSPLGTIVDIDLRTFASLDTAGRVDSRITLPGKAPENWRILLLYVDGQWRVYTMESM